MSDTQRLDWLERDPRRLVCSSNMDRSGYKFQVAIKGTGAVRDPWEFSTWFGNMRDAIDEGMKHNL